MASIIVHKQLFPPTNKHAKRLRALIAIACGMLATLAPAAEPRPTVAIIISGLAVSDVDHQGVSFAASRKELHNAESLVADCIGRAVSSRHPHLAVMRPDDFYRLAFPALTSEEAPRSLDSLTILLQDAAFRERLATANVAYLIVAGGATERRDRTGAVNFYFLGGGLGGIVWFWGTAVWDNESRLAAYVIDLKREVTSGQVTAAAKDESTFGVHIFLPTGTPSFAQAEACAKLGATVAEGLQKVAPTSTQR